MEPAIWMPVVGVYEDSVEALYRVGHAPAFYADWSASALLDGSPH